MLWLRPSQWWLNNAVLRDVTQDNMALHPTCQYSSRTAFALHCISPKQCLLNLRHSPHNTLIFSSFYFRRTIWHDVTQDTGLWNKEVSQGACQLVQQSWHIIITVEHQPHLDTDTKNAYDRKHCVIFTTFWIMSLLLIWNIIKQWFMYIVHTFKSLLINHTFILGIKMECSIIHHKFT